MKRNDILEGLRDPKDNPCWKGYKPVGTKKKAGKTVPNCVPKEGVEKNFIPERVTPEWLEVNRKAKELLAKGMTVDQVAQQLGVQGPNNGMTGSMGGLWGAINKAAQEVQTKEDVESSKNVTEHKKGTKAVKYNKKPSDPASAHAKAKEKLAPVKPVQEGRQDAYDRDYQSSISGMSGRRREVDDEANLMYRYNSERGKLTQKMIDVRDERSARAEGWRYEIADALRVANIIRSKFDPNKFVQKIGGKWVPVNPFADAPKKDDVAEGEGQVTASDPTKGVEITNPQTGVKTTIPPKMASALAPDAQNPNRYTLNPKAVEPGAEKSTAPQGPKVGAQVNIPDQATEETAVITELDPPPNDSTSPIHGGRSGSDADHNEIIRLLKKLAGMQGMKREMDNGPVRVQTGIRSDLGQMAKLAGK